MTAAARAAARIRTGKADMASRLRSRKDLMALHARQGKSARTAGFRVAIPSRKMRPAIGLFLPVAGLILGCWWWLGAPVAMPPSPLNPGEKLYCVSYTPFRDNETPL